MPIFKVLNNYHCKLLTLLSVGVVTVHPKLRWAVPIAAMVSIMKSAEMGGVLCHFAEVWFFVSTGGTTLISFDEKYATVLFIYFRCKLIFYIHVSY